MVCAKCAAKRCKIATPDVVKTIEKKYSDKKGASDTRIVGNKLLEFNRKMKDKGSLPACKSCKVSLTTEGKYCSQCAYYQGLCAVCGKKVVDLKNHRKGQTLWS